MVHDLAVTQVFGRDLGHFLISQGEVPDVDVLLHPLHMDGLGDDGHVPLGTPAEGHLGRDLAVLFAGVLLSGTFYIMSVDNSLFGQAVGKQIDNGSDMGTFTPTDKPNAPMGVARGIHPGRVAWAHDPQAAVWDGKHGLYSDADNNSQTRVCDMMEGVIISLTHQKTIDRAWDELFRTFNKKKGKGATGYKEGEKIADRYEVTWSSLFVNRWKDGQEQRNNMTEFAFSKATSDPEGFKAGLKEKIEILMK